MKMKTAFFLVLTLLIGLAPGSTSLAGYDAQPPVETTAEDDDGCGDESAFYMTHTLVPLLTLRVCDGCQLDDAGRDALFMSYGTAASRAGHNCGPTEQCRIPDHRDRDVA